MSTSMCTFSLACVCDVNVWCEHVHAVCAWRPGGGSVHGG